MKSTSSADRAWTELNAVSTDVDLFRRYRAEGDMVAFGELYDRYAGPVFNFLCRMLRDSKSAEDVLQHVFLRLHEFRDAFDVNQSFRTWIFTIARRLAINWNERQVLKRELISDVDVDIPTKARTPEDWVVLKSELRSIEDALSDLPREHVEALLLFKLGELTHQEVGAVLGCSADAAKMRVHRALRQLAEKLGVTAKRRQRVRAGAPHQAHQVANAHASRCIERGARL